MIDDAERTAWLELLAERALAAFERYVDVQERRLNFEERRDLDIRAERAAKLRLDRARSRLPPEEAS